MVRRSGGLASRELCEGGGGTNGLAGREQKGRHEGDSLKTIEKKMGEKGKVTI